MMHTLDLGNYRSGKSLVFAGRERGLAVREKSRIGSLESSSSEVKVVVPEDTLSINSSFFLGLFGETIRNLGESEFRRRFSFCGANIADIVEDGIKEALRKGSPLQ